jgi:hypothetical protein
LAARLAFGRLCLLSERTGTEKHEQKRVEPGHGGEG